MVMVGTRPEAIKMAPVVMALKRRSDVFGVHLCSSGQHGTMLEQTLNSFGLSPDSSLDVMTVNQSLSGLSSRLFGSLDSAMAAINPDAVLVQGDTTTVQVASLCAFYRGIPIGHVEAGLRTANIHNPFPEELNRRIVALVANWHYAPTENARENLLVEGVRAEDILVTGNTVIDALHAIRAINQQRPFPLPMRLEKVLAENRPYILVTGHRRENFGEGMRNICDALARIARVLPDARLVYPVHLNPNVRGPVMDLLGGIENIILEEPVPYACFVRLLKEATVILTDSGGIQEEGVALGKPVLIMREATERPEGIKGGSRLVGTDPGRITEAAVNAFRNPGSRTDTKLFGNGDAAERIVEHLAEMLGLTTIPGMRRSGKRCVCPDALGVPLDIAD